MYYIQEIDKPNFWLSLFNIVRLQGDKIILPVGIKKIKAKKAEKLANQTQKILEKANTKQVVVSKAIKKQKEYLNYLHMYDLKIIDGKWLFEVLSSQVLEYIVEKKDLKKEKIQVSILINEVTDPILENIKQIVRQYKRANIVTNHREKFKNIEKQILENEGIMITVSNNKKKSLCKSKIILNVDFPSELINQYNFNDEAIIVNIRGNVRITRKRFNGMNINNYNIDFKSLEEFDYDKNNLYERKDIYEAQISARQPFGEIKKKVKKDGVKITELVGNKTIL